MCDTLLEKYNWFDIREKDLDLFVSGNTYDCEVPDALMFIDGFDDVIRNKRDFREAKCYVTEHGSWSFADVRGSASSTSK